MLEYYYIIFGIALAMVNADNERLGKCFEVFKLETMKAMCCEKRLIEDALMECEGEKDMCEKSTCALKKMGIEIVNNKIDESSVVKAMDRIMKDKPEMKYIIEGSRKFCMDGHYKQYEPMKNICDPANLVICLYFQTMSACDQWKNDDTCQKVEATAKECKKELEDEFS